MSFLSPWTKKINFFKELIFLSQLRKFAPRAGEMSWNDIKMVLNNSQYIKINLEIHFEPKIAFPDYEWLFKCRGDKFPPPSHIGLRDYKIFPVTISPTINKFNKKLIISNITLIFAKKLGQILSVQGKVKTIGSWTTPSEQSKKVVRPHSQ